MLPSLWQTVIVSSISEDALFLTVMIQCGRQHSAVAVTHELMFFVRECSTVIISIKYSSVLIFIPESTQNLAFSLCPGFTVSINFQTVNFS